MRVSTGLGAVLVRALVSPRQQVGSIFVPMHWNDQFASRARVDVLVPAVTDAISGQPASKNIAARIERFVAAAYGFAVLRHKPRHIDAEYWAIAKCRGGWRVELGFASKDRDWPAFVADLVGGEASQLVAYHDVKTGHHRFACYEDDRLTGAVFLAPEPVAVSRDWAIAQLSAQHSARKRSSVIAGRPGKGTVDRGAIVCSCFGIGASEIAAAGGARMHDGRGSRQSAACRHQLRLLPRGNSHDHRRQSRSRAGTRDSPCGRRVQLERSSTMHALSELLSEGEPLARRSPGALVALARRLLRAATDLATRLRGNAWLATQTRNRVVTLGPLQRPARGCVMLVGAGPGDPELLTLKALQAVRGADIILYDQLVSDEILALSPARAERIAVGKKGYGKACKQGEINELMVALAAAGRRVVRLKAGDPLMFGRLEEEMAALEAAGIAFMSSPAYRRRRAPQRASMCRSRAGVVHAVSRPSRGMRTTGACLEDFDWAGLADPKATTAVYMPKATIGELCAELMRRGLSASHPAAAVFNATRPSEVTLAATLATLPERIADTANDAPCIVLVGEAVARLARRPTESAELAAAVRS